MRTLVLAVALVALAGCAERGSGTSGPGTATAPPGDELVVEVDPGDGGTAERYTLTCGETPGGDHPDPGAACAHLAGLEDPFAPLPADVACTEVYGGPQTARVTGSWDGAPVDVALSRTDGCLIEQWDGLGPLLPGPVGVDELPG
ncbi:MULTISPECIES: SSI family serine proteinase inhibitor [unclassified Geodermatophilus]